MTSSFPRDVIKLLLLVQTVITHDPGVTHSGVIKKEGESYSPLRYKNVEYLNTQENEQIKKCISRLDYTPISCHTYMGELMRKFLPYTYRPDKFHFQEVLTWSLDRYDVLMGLCEDNCYNYTLAYSYRNCTADLPVQNFFPGLTNRKFSDMLRDLGALLCHKNPAGNSCLKYEADLLTGRIKMEETIRERCLIRDETTNDTILPAYCLPQCKLFLQRKKEEYGCCLTSWRTLTNYTSDLSRVLHLYPDKLYKLLQFCEIEPPAGCPYAPDLSKLSAGLVTFLGVAGGVAFLVLMAGVIKNFRES
ncbi:hypothetical protein ACHWQZ_G015159 [Mnemiopsis leidyi]